MYEYILYKTNVRSARWKMNFAEVLEPRFRYSFSDSICYISVRSIEYEYHRICQSGDSPRSGTIFSAWLLREKELNYPTINSVYNFVMINPRKHLYTAEERNARLRQLITTNICSKQEYLIHSDPITGSLFIHPMLAVMFSIALSENFAVEVIGHINGLKVAGGVVDTTTYGKMREELDERDLAIADYKKSAIACETLVNGLYKDIETANKENTKLNKENMYLYNLLEQERGARKSFWSQICDRIVQFRARRKITPGSDNNMYLSQVDK